MDFTCTQPGCVGKTYTRLSGWKRHMTSAHGGYDERDIAEVVAASDGGVSEENVAARMQAFSRTIPTGETGAGVEGASPDSATSPETPLGRSTPPPPTPKPIRATPKKLKKILGGIPKSMLEGSGIELDDEDREALDESGEFLADIFGVEFEVSQEKKVLHSRFWAIAWVAGVALMIYVKHRFSDVWAKVILQYQKSKETTDGEAKSA